MVLAMQSKKRGVKIDPTLGLQGLRRIPKMMDIWGLNPTEGINLFLTYYTSSVNCKG